MLQKALARLGGKERYTLQLAKSLVELGHEVAILSSAFDNALDAAVSTVDRVPLDGDSSSHFGRYRRFVDSVDQHLQSRRYDIVHSMLPVKQCDFYHLHSTLAADDIVNGHLRESSMLSRHAQRFFNRFNRKRRYQAMIEHELLSPDRNGMTQIICPSNILSEITLEFHPSTKGHIVTAPNGVNLEQYFPCETSEQTKIRQILNLPTNKIIGVLVANNWELKGVRETIIALAELDNPNIHIVIVGGDEPGPFERLAKTLRIEKQITFAGRKANMLPHYQASDFFLLPTRSDACSLSTLEAVACGLPVISTKQNGACELLTDSVHGFVIPQTSDIEALSNAMQTMADSVARNKMRTACINLRPALSWKTHVDKIVAAYEIQCARKITLKHPQVAYKG